MISICLATYNGSQYIKEQIASVLPQLAPDDEMIISDDGSTDDTLALVLSFSDDRIIVEKGPCRGSAPLNFENALRYAKGDYIFFCDQDDVWLPEKIAAGVKALKRIEADGIPSLYFCNTNLVDAEGHFIQKGLNDTLKLTKGNSLIESFGAGCTMCFNKPLHHLLLSHLTEGKVYHDRWAYLTAMFLGRVVYDPTAYINYRQHGNNTVGTKTENEKGKSVNRLFAPHPFSISETAQTLLDYYGNLIDERDKKLIKTCSHYKTTIASRMKLAFANDFKLAYGGFSRRVFWSLRLLLGKL